MSDDVTQAPGSTPPPKPPFPGQRPDESREGYLRRTVCCPICGIRICEGCSCHFGSEHGEI